MNVFENYPRNIVIASNIRPRRVNRVSSIHYWWHSTIKFRKKTAISTNKTWSARNSNIFRVLWKRILPYWQTICYRRLQAKKEDMEKKSKLNSIKKRLLIFGPDHRNTQYSETLRTIRKETNEIQKKINWINQRPGSFFIYID